MTRDPGRRPWRTDDEWAQLSQRIAIAGDTRERSTIRRAAMPLVAAAALIAAVATAVLFRRSSTALQQTVSRTVTTAAGERATITLADSTLITIGPATTLRIELTTARRSITLDGLAEFHVAHDARRPFTVRAGNAVATDIGTEFVVRAYGADSATRVSVLSGIVSLGCDTLATCKATTLSAGDIGVAARTGVSRVASAAGSSADVAWIDGSLQFDDVPLGQVATELSRWFGADVRIEPGIASRRITALYAKQSLDDVLSAIDATLHVAYRREGKVVIIAPRPE